ncbi:uncharacterized protein LOC110708444 [Chenopodium quinoa]|uniref:uncharacterized protein LOC110708444 n=1 Tax=Chenopodium quinoa TaxID=63459 RepID=UPI000B77D764|nr:uncharacterized protein LOC110708444 [Chenopodium quinoa]
MRDFEGFTPVVRAVQCCRLGLARLLIEQYPQSVGIPDYKGRTILHHMGAQAVDLVDDLQDIMPVWKDFFQYGEVDDLRIAQDEDGNTPLHYAISNDNFTKAKFLMGVCLLSKNQRELDIVNSNGLTVFDLVASRAHIPSMKELQPLVNRSRVKETELIKEMMDDDLYIAAKKGDFGDLIANTTETTDVENRPPRDDQWFCRRTPGGSNIIHVVLRHANGNDKATKFVTTALSKWPILSMRQDNNGDTPLHLTAKWKTGVPLNLLVDASKEFLSKLDKEEKAFHVAPWAVKNYKGSYPIHEALQADNLGAAWALLECDREAADRVNDLGETPLHAFAKYGFSIGNSLA